VAGQVKFPHVAEQHVRESAAVHVVPAHRIDEGFGFGTYSAGHEKSLQVAEQHVVESAAAHVLPAHRIDEGFGFSR